MGSESVIRLEVQIDAFPGWATVVLHTKARVLDIPCSDLGGDSLGELARAFVKLMEIEHKRVEIDCYGEPQNTLIALHRRGSDLEVTIKRFSWEGDGAPEDTIRRAIRSGKPKEWKKMERARNKKAKLRERGPFVDAMRSLAESFQRIDHK